MSNTTKILLAGEGGQGIQTIAKVLTGVASASDQFVSYIPVFGVEQRGTPSVALIILSDREILYPRFDAADIVVILQKRAVSHVSSYIAKNTRVIVDSSTIAKKDLPENLSNFFGLPATKLAHEDFSSKALNLIVLGKLGQLLGFKSDLLVEKVGVLLAKKVKTEAMRLSNKKALEAGYSYILEADVFTKPTYQPATGVIVSKGYDKIAQISPAQCKGCGICIFKCPVGALKFSSTLGVFGTPIPEIDLAKCIGCGNCFRFCPDAAIRVEILKKKS